MNMINNPILPGFNPDPSIIRVGDDYYIATSSFEWYPGIPIYHSRDLNHWHLIDYALKTKEHIDLQSLSPSKGVWAPCLSYNENEGLFYIIYSNVYDRNRWHFDIDNFLIFSKSINGPWSKPIYINSSGIDPSLFHDGDKKWVINQERDFRPGTETRRPIIIQEYDSKAQKLIGESVRLTYGATVRGFTEGAHMYKNKRNGLYYLTTAEGGTGYGHCVALLRSENVTGPFEACPHNPILTSCTVDVPMNPNKSCYLEELYNPNTIIQKAGHGSLVETQNGELYIAHLCGRPVLPQLRCVLGRETAIQKMEWTSDNWLRLCGNNKNVNNSISNIALDTVHVPNLPEYPFLKEPARCDFDENEFNLHFNSPREPITPDWADIKSKKGYLRLRGRESLCSNHQPSLIARRLTSFNATVTVKMNFKADRYQHIAGLTCYYEPFNYYYICKTYSEETQTNVLTTYGMINKQLADFGDAVVQVEKDADIWLRADIRTDKLQFLYSLDGEAFFELGNEFDMTTLSDEASEFGEFTGTYIGMFAQDAHTREKWAEFDYFEYEESN